MRQATTPVRHIAECGAAALALWGGMFFAKLTSEQSEQHEIGPAADEIRWRREERHLMIALGMGRLGGIAALPARQRAVAHHDAMERGERRLRRADRC